MADTLPSRVPGAIPGIPRTISAIWRIHRTNLPPPEQRSLLYSGRSVLGSFLFPPGLFLLLARLGLVCLDFHVFCSLGGAAILRSQHPSIIRAAVRRASGCGNQTLLVVFSGFLDKAGDMGRNFFRTIRAEGSRPKSGGVLQAPPGEDVPAARRLHAYRMMTAGFSHSAPGFVREPMPHVRPHHHQGGIPAGGPDHHRP